MFLTKVVIFPRYFERGVWWNIDITYLLPTKEAFLLVQSPCSIHINKKKLVSWRGENLLVFLGRMKSFIGKMVKVDQGFQEAGVGRLLDVSDDHLVLLTEEDGVVYYNNDHIESVTENTKEFNLVSPEDIGYNKANNLLNLLETQILKWVKINSDGPVKIEGVLYDVNNDIISLIYDKEIVYVSFNHLHHISIG